MKEVIIMCIKCFLACCLWMIFVAMLLDVIFSTANRLWG